jgi:dTDP-4-dehydrorhamnose 3,5-epimerase
MEILATEIPAVKIIITKRFQDHRGFFSETYNKRALSLAGIDLDFVQDNHSLSVERGVLRGLHYQLEPYAQDKLVRVIRGTVFDVAIDIRRGSPTFGKHVSAEIRAEDWKQVLVPKGFAHGFVTLEPNTEVIYKVTNYYSPSSERGILWNDPQLNIPWPVPSDQVILSDRDKRWPKFSEVTDFSD